MSVLPSISTEIAFKNVLSYALKLFQEIQKQGYLSCVESTFVRRSHNIRTLESEYLRLWLREFSLPLFCKLF